MRWSYRLLPIVAVLGFWASPVTARAGQVIVGNLDQPPSPIFSPSQIDTQDFWAQQFTTGVSTTLTSVQASLGEFNAGMNGNFMVTAQLFVVGSASMTPDQGSLVASFSQVGTIPTGDGNFANVEFDPIHAVGLDSSKFYWLVLSGANDATGAAQWQSTDSNASSGPGTLTGYSFFNSGSWGAPTAGTPFLIEVDGTVPEPSSLLLGCIGLSAVVLAARFRMRAAQPK